MKRTIGMLVAVMTVACGDGSVADTGLTGDADAAQVQSYGGNGINVYATALSGGAGQEKALTWRNNGSTGATGLTGNVLSTGWVGGAAATWSMQVQLDVYCAFGQAQVTLATQTGSVGAPLVRVSSASAAAGGNGLAHVTLTVPAAAYASDTIFYVLVKGTSYWSVREQTTNSWRGNDGR